MSFSQRLFQQISPDFLKLLGVRSAPLLLDIVSALEDALKNQPHGLERDDAVALAEGIIEGNPGATAIDDENGGAVTNSRERARVVIERLCKAGWLERIEQTNYSVLLVLESPASLILKTLRAIAYAEAVFSDKISGVCATVTNSDIMSREPWAAVLRSVDQAEGGLAELHGMGKSIERHTQRQVVAATIKQNLQEIYDRFNEGASGRCYQELVLAGLHERLGPAKRAVDDLYEKESALETMRAELMRREQQLAPEMAMSRVLEKIDYLSSLLSSVRPRTERVDQRAAEFVRRSYARFRYLQESSNDRRGKVRAFFEFVNKVGAGRRAADLEDHFPIPVPPLRLADVQIFAGGASLSRGRRALRSAEVQPVSAEVNAETSRRQLGDFAKHLRTALTVGRANRFVARLPGGRGARICVRNFALTTEDDVADLIACLLHGGSRQAKYKVEISRVAEETDLLIWHKVIDGVYLETITLVKE